MHVCFVCSVDVEFKAPPKRHMDRLRKVCLGYPEVWEDAPWGHPVFKAGKKIFVSAGDADGSWGLALPVGHDLQELLLQKDGYYRPSYVGNKGWIGVYLDKDTDWTDLKNLVDLAYRRVALKRMVTLLDAPSKVLDSA